MRKGSAHLVGILNRTPDSFSDGGQYFNVDDAVSHVETMFRQGASMVDVGAESTRPGAEPLSPEEEWLRLGPLLQQIVFGHLDSIAIDSYHPETVRKIAAEIGPFVVNDVTGMNNPLMREAVADLGLRCIVSHLPYVAGADIQKAHDTKPITSINQVVEELSERIEEMESDGIRRGSIIVDPGFGFGKDPKINGDLLDLPTYLGLNEFEYYIGVSRKSSLRRRDFYGDPLADFDSMTQEEVTKWLDDRSVDVAKTALYNGYTYLRVHNVAAHAVLLSSTS